MLKRAATSKLDVIEASAALGNSSQKFIRTHFPPNLAVGINMVSL